MEIAFVLLVIAIIFVVQAVKVVPQQSAWVLERLGGLRHWSQLRADWLEPQAHGSLVLLALWPFALL